MLEYLHSLTMITLCTLYNLVLDKIILKLACGTLDLQKTFDTVEHNILLTKLEYHGIRGLTNDWFKSYLSDKLFQ